MTKPCQHSRAGISWPEILFVLSLFLITASVIVPVWLDSQQRLRSVQSYSDIRLLIEASSSFNREYRLWPVHDAPARGDARYGDRIANAGVMRILMAIDGPGNPGHRNNPNQIDFLELASADSTTLRLNDLGEVIDPWGNPYQMVFDSNYDNICTIANSIHGSVMGEGVAIWSKGADRKSDTSDDLLSWKR